MQSPEKNSDKSAKGDLLAALANNARLNILFALFEGEKNVTKLAADLGLGQTLVSHSLARLEKNGFVKKRRQGNFHFYALNEEFSLPFLHAIDPTLKRSSQADIRLRAIVTQSPILIIVFDKDGIVTFVSGDPMPRFGLSMQKMLGRRLVELRRAPRGLDRQVFEGKTVVWNMKRNGRSFDILTVPYKDEDGVPIGGITVSHDVTERDNAEAILKKVADEWRSLAEGSPDLIANIDKAGVFLLANRELGGNTREKVIGTVLYDYLPEPIRAEVGAKVKQAFASGLVEKFRSTGLGKGTAAAADGLFECRIVPRSNKGKVVSVTFTARELH